MHIQTIETIAEEIRAVYRHLHAHPELSGEEAETARFLKSELEALGPEVKDYGQHALSIDIVGEGGPGRLVAIRADTDALPILEETGLSYRSKNEGVMHACGHDVHMAVLLGTARYFMHHRNFPGTLRLLFQPDEEKNGGAEPMVKKGAMDGVDYVIGLHVSHQLPLGVYGVLPGFMNASVDDFVIEIRGKGGHAAHPQECKDPIVAGAHVICALQTIVSRKLSPLDPAVVTVGSAHGGTKPNIIPDTFTLTGTLRAHTAINRGYLQKKLAEIAETTARAFDCEAKVEILEGYIPLFNDPDTTEKVRRALADAFGEERVRALPSASMGAEDFAYFAEAARGTFFNIGVAPKEGPVYPTHSSRFAPQESALFDGIAGEVAAALYLLQESE
ncbi:amidohydrolase [Peptoniphilus ivorii]|uniref:M20 metallopeptidase family protein n=1 Tax=Aedoeadaptatus ivorii TaxID=54006 RepID=UPI0027835FC8|nr:amidohydrolase [Peptoniphilus ivorii]MDQ0508506.1 amidohydrolase [Peptoniphilus ivorii]